jgi:hypothetical protein
VSTAFASKKDAEAAALLEHAKQLSDIRAEGAPAFRLKLSFKVIKEDGSALQGAYTEVWVSKSQWRRETVLGDFRRTQVAAGKKLWRLDSTTAVPEHIGDISTLSAIGRFQPERWKPGRIEDREIEGLSVRCLETNPDPRGLRSSLCFDKSSGTLAAQVKPLEMETRIAEQACFFSDYQKFGSRVLATSYECAEDKHPRLQQELSNWLPSLRLTRHCSHRWTERRNRLTASVLLSLRRSSTSRNPVPRALPAAEAWS